MNINQPTKPIVNQVGQTFNSVQDLISSGVQNIQFLGGKLHPDLVPFAQTANAKETTTPTPTPTPQPYPTPPPQQNQTSNNTQFLGGDKSIFDKIKDKLSSMFGTKTVQIDNTAQAKQTQYDPSIFVFKPREENKLIGLMISEAGAEGPQGMQGVLNTIINRTQVNPKYYGANVWDVISKPQQYTGFNIHDPNYKETLDYLDGKKIALTPSRQEQITLAKQLLAQAMNGELTDVTNGATHYYNPAKAAHASWMDNADQRAQIGNHTFLYLKQ